MKIALFGGTFNPVHTGHLLLAEAARDRFHLDRVIFLPTGLPPHKKSPRTPAAHRLAMLRLAISGNPAFRVDSWEIRQHRLVYTVEALQHFKAIPPKHTLYFILGSDSLADLPGWREGTGLLDLCRFLVVERPVMPWKSIPLRLRRRAQLVPSQPVPFSSEVIRDRVRAGRSIRYHVPDSVERYIRRHRLYRVKEAM